MIRAWVALWNEEEPPSSIALVRMLLGAVVFWDLAQVWRLGLVIPLFAPQEAGGWADIGSRGPPFPYSVLPLEPWVAQTHHGLMLLAAACLTLGWFTRTSALALLLLWSAHWHCVPEADRAVDLLCRDFLGILVLSGAGRTLSLDAWWTTGDPRGDGGMIGAWARYLIIAQLVLMYFTAGLQKIGLQWLPMGDFAALYVILQDPAIARFQFGFLAQQPWYLVSQVGTLVTVTWQWFYPLVLLWFFYARTPERPGRLRAFANRWKLHLVWVVVGAVFHLVLAATTELGIFPWAMLAAYAAFLTPTRLAPASAGA